MQTKGRPRLDRPKAYKTIDAQNTASGQGDKHPVLMRAFVTAAPRVSFHESNKYGPAGDKSSKYKSSRYSSDKDGKHNRGHRSQGGTTLPSHTLLHITCDCDDTDIDTMYRSCCISTNNSSSSVTVLYSTLVLTPLRS